MKQPPTREFLDDLYRVKNLTMKEIMEITGYSRSRIFAFLVQYGIERDKRKVEVSEERPLTKSRTDVPMGELSNYYRIPGKEWLEVRYLTDNFSVVEIARELGVNPNSVTKALHRYGIPIKPHYASYIGRAKTIATRFRHSIREKIFKRDDYKCRMCGSTESLEVHHIVPKRLGGHNTVDNGITLCEKCHSSIGARETNRIGELLELRGHTEV